MLNVASCTVVGSLQRVVVMVLVIDRDRGRGRCCCLLVMLPGLKHLQMITWELVMVEVYSMTCDSW